MAHTITLSAAQMRKAFGSYFEDLKKRCAANGVDAEVLASIESQHNELLTTVGKKTAKVAPASTQKKKSPAAPSTKVAPAAPSKKAQKIAALKQELATLTNVSLETIAIESVTELRKAIKEASPKKPRGKKAAAEEKPLTEAEKARREKLATLVSEFCELSRKKVSKKRQNELLSMKVGEVKKVIAEEKKAIKEAEKEKAKKLKEKEKAKALKEKEKAKKKALKEKEKAKKKAEKEKAKAAKLAEKEAKKAAKLAEKEKKKALKAGKVAPAGPKVSVEDKKKALIAEIYETRHATGDLLLSNAGVDQSNLKTTKIGTLRDILKQVKAANQVDGRVVEEVVGELVEEVERAENEEVVKPTQEIDAVIEQLNEIEIVEE